ncbi:low molecular weight phosphotyrosine protein phosphatase [Marinobacter halodurans]|uniref:protein-tyrosine-phosphatase n=1 Tax=Marinobacter halodurans TaxID=2528979 RepID=A0ABY1ZNE6_9GAMM|nr:low molecular weight protein-tyrosine-phosphatase [Marinobacter halodurans]TBW58078.1 low molecular weight phosphotyrosine protein phosphatase [Marinobacter halodurans]
MTISRVLVLCVGNICRSPMAEVMLRDGFQRQGMNNVQVRSAGIATIDGRPADPNALRVMQNNGLDGGSHRSQRVAWKMIAWAELILVMEDFQKQYIESEFPEARGKVFLIGHWRRVQVPDPYRGNYSLFEASYQLLSQCSSDWVQRLSVALADA